MGWRRRTITAVLVVGLLVAAACESADRYARRVPQGVSHGHPLTFFTFGGLARRGQPEGAKPIALTFDDGPGPNTPAILDTLEREHVPATFFMVGREVRGREATVARILADGDRIGAHSWDHANLRHVHGQDLVNEVEWPLNVLGPLMPAGDPITCFRPPFGNSNDEVRTVLADRGLAEAHWSVDPDDWQNPGADAVVDRVLSHAFAGAVVLMHDGGAHPGTVQALPRIISWLKAAGYSFVSLC